MAVDGGGWGPTTQEIGNLQARDDVASDRRVRGAHPCEPEVELGSGGAGARRGSYPLAVPWAHPRSPSASQEGSRIIPLAQVRRRAHLTSPRLLPGGYERSAASSLGSRYHSDFGHPSDDGVLCPVHEGIRGGWMLPSVIRADRHRSNIAVIRTKLRGKTTEFRRLNHASVFMVSSRIGM